MQLIMYIYIFRKIFFIINLGDDNLALKAQSARKNRSKIYFLDACEDEDDGFIEGGVTKKYYQPLALE